MSLNLFETPPVEPHDPIREVFDYWRERMGYTTRKLTPTRQQKIRSRLKAFSVEDLKKVVDRVAGDPWWRGRNNRNTPYDDITNIFLNDERVERFLSGGHNDSKLFKKEDNDNPSGFTF